MWYTYTMEYYSAIRKNEVLPFVAIQYLEIITLNEVSQTKTNIMRYCDTCILKKWYTQTYFQNRKRLTDLENFRLLLINGKVGGEIDLEAGTNIYILPHIK